VQDEAARAGDTPTIEPSNGGLALHMAARVDGEHKNPVGMGVTADNSHESPQFDALTDDIEVFADLDSVILIFDRG